MERKKRKGGKSKEGLDRRRKEGDERKDGRGRTDAGVDLAGGRADPEATLDVDVADVQRDGRVGEDELRGL